MCLTRKRKIPSITVSEEFFLCVCVMLESKPREGSVHVRQELTSELYLSLSLILKGEINSDFCHAF